MYPKVKITQVRSLIGRQKDQCATVKALGLARMNHTVEKECTPQVLGMIKKVSHLIKVEEA